MQGSSQGDSFFFIKKLQFSRGVSRTRLLYNCMVKPQLTRFVNWCVERKFHVKRNRTIVVICTTNNRSRKLFTQFTKFCSSIRTTRNVRHDITSCAHQLLSSSNDH